MTTPPRGLAVLIVLVCALHVAVLWRGFVMRVPGDQAAREAPAMSTRWVVLPVQQRSEPEPLLAALARKPARGHKPAPGAAAEPPPAAATDTAAPAPVFTEPAPREPAWRPDGVQRAAREAAQRKGLAELSDERLGQQPLDAQAALRRGVASAARGDCLKGGEGGYANSGLGLLALPLLVVDAATGRCR